MTISDTEKWGSIALLVIAEILIFGLWFSASATLPQMTAQWRLSNAAQSWMTMSVQVGFVAGALIIAFSNLADRVPPHRLIAACALGGAAANAGIALVDHAPTLVFLLRFSTGTALAGTYPPGMKLAATWCQENRGLGIGLVVGGTVLGNAVPHLLNGFPLLSADGMPPWRAIILGTSALAALGAAVVGISVKEGPYLTGMAPFNWRFAGRVLRHRPTRLANFGYLGHMWELFSMWTWVPVFLILSFDEAGWSTAAARMAGFAAIAAGAFSSVAAGLLADRFGRSYVTVGSLILSGACTLCAGFFFAAPGLLTILCVVWGAAVVADSAQFSAAVSELTDPRYVGTALTVQTTLGFLLTLVSIRIIPALADIIGWEWVFVVLAPGPAFGIWSMLKLRRTPEATRMASGHR
ncbi:MAG: MFS transporter [Deltaproteobacteria bacterium]|nr:MFS transporter [Deltaproteobacteria bacterium]